MRKSLLLLLLLLTAPAARAAETVPVTLDADEIHYDDHTGQTMATGHASLHYAGMVLTADRMEMDTKTQLVQAWSDSPARPLVFVSEGRTLRGSYAAYKLDDRRGQMADVTGQMPAGLGTAYLRAATAETAGVDDAMAAGWFKSRYRKKLNDDDAAVLWHKVRVTTCPLPHPHYELRTNRLVVVPGRWVIAKHPRVYLGGLYLFTYPFDYVVSGRTTRRQPFMPSLVYDSDKLIGVSSRGAFYWPTGQFSLDTYLWSRHGVEATVRIDQTLTPWASIYFQDGYTWEKDLDQKKLRPRWGTLLDVNGWKAELYWSEREKLSVYRKPGEKTYETSLWRKPEFRVTSPWLSIYTGDVAQYLQFDAIWGRYQESGNYYDDSWNDRYGWGVRYFSDYPIALGRGWSLTPFFDFQHHQYHYDVTGGANQRVTNTKFGLLARCGGFSVGLAYALQRVDGRSPFSWDRYSNADTLYPRLGFDLGRSWHVDVQGLIDMKDVRKRDYWTKQLMSVDYQLTYDDHCCMRWIFFVHDDLGVNNDDTYGISMEITAFPEATYKFGLSNISNEFSRPGVPARRRSSGTRVIRPLDTERSAMDDVYRGLSARSAGVPDQR